MGQLYLEPAYEVQVIRKHIQGRGRSQNGEEIYAYTLTRSKENVIEEFRIWTRLQIFSDIFQAHDIADEIINRVDGNYTDDQETKKVETIAAHNAQREIMRAAKALSVGCGSKIYRSNDGCDQ